MLKFLGQFFFRFLTVWLVRTSNPASPGSQAPGTIFACERETWLKVEER